MTAESRGRLPLVDRRYFSWEEYRRGPVEIWVRGFPERRDTFGEQPPRPVLDLLFTDVRRISCSKTWEFLALRVADEDQRSHLAKRIGGIDSDCHLYLLEQGSLDHHVIAGKVYWAEYLLEENLASPLWEMGSGRQQSLIKPVGDTIYYHD